MSKIYQQVDSQYIHIGTSVNEDWFVNKMGALDVEAPEYNAKTHKAKWVNDSWIIKTIEEWNEENKISI